MARKSEHPSSRVAGARTTAGKAGPSAAAETAGFADWMAVWLDPRTYADLHLDTATADAQRSIVDVCEDMSMAQLAFAHERITKDFATVRNIAAASDISGYGRIAMEFWQTAWDDYRDHMLLMGDKVRELADDTEELICEATDETTREARKTVG